MSRAAASTTAPGAIAAAIGGAARPLDVRTLAILTRKELRDSLRNRWFILYTVAFSVLALGLAYMSRAGTGLSGLSGFGRTAAGLINLVLLIVPLMALTVGASSIAAERERGMLAYLLAQPVNRIEVLAGKFIGLALALTGSLAIGFGLVAGLMAMQRSGTDAASFLRLVGLTVLLALVMLAVGMLISTLMSRNSAAIGVAVFVWLALVMFGDLGLMTATVVARLHVQDLFALSLISPLQAFKMAAIGSFNASLDVLGPAGVYAIRRFGSALPWILVSVLVAWTMVPLGLSAWIFSRRAI